MPFKSEKQRRYLWLKHPDIAKRWAHEYPNQKKLPMYADKKESEKTSAAEILSASLPKYLHNAKNTEINTHFAENMKESDSKQEYVKLPKTTGPTFAGEVEAQATEKPVEDGLNDKSELKPCKQDELTAHSLLKKMAVVLSPRIMQELENEQAAQQAREAKRMPQNVGIKRLPPVVNSILPPMGMPQPAPNPGQTQPAQPQPQTGQLASVGGGNSPNANPINSFGGLSSTGDINGNAALGTQNMAGGEKISASSPAWQRSAGKNEEGGLNAKGRASYNKATGGNLKAPVTESNPKGKRAKRQNSFCSRMCGMKKHETGSKTKKDPESRINKALRKWNCKCSSAMAFGEKIAGKALDLALLGLPLVTGGLGAAWGSRMGENNWAHRGENPADPGGFNASMLGATWGGLGGAGLGLIPGLLNKYEMRNGKIYPRQEYLKRWKGYTGLDHLIEEEKIGAQKCSCGSEKTAGWLGEMFAKNWPNTSRALENYSPELVFQTTPLQTALGAAAGAGYGGLTGQGVVRNALRGGLIGTGAGVGGIYGSQVAAGLNNDINGPYDNVLNNNSYMVGQTAGTLGGALGGNQLYNVLERMYDSRKNTAKNNKAKKEKQAAGNETLAWLMNINNVNVPDPDDLDYDERTQQTVNALRQKAAQDFDPALSRDAENAVMHGTGLVGSGVLGTVAGIPVSAGLEHVVRQNNLMPDSEKNPWKHLLVQGLLRSPIIAGGMLGTRLYDNYILRPHMKREMERKQQEEAVRQQLMKKQAEASLQRVLGTALASAGGGLLLGAYPGWKLQRASEAAGNSEFTNFVAGKAPIALTGALSAGLYNHWLDSHEKKTKKQSEPAHPTMKYLQYLVH